MGNGFASAFLHLPTAGRLQICRHECDMIGTVFFEIPSRNYKYPLSVKFLSDYLIYERLNYEIDMDWSKAEKKEV